MSNPNANELALPFACVLLLSFCLQARRELGGLNDYACPGTAMTTWLNRSDVRAALNIQPNNRFNSADNGAFCDFCDIWFS